MAKFGEISLWKSNEVRVKHVVGCGSRFKRLLICFGGLFVLKWDR